MDVIWKLLIIRGNVTRYEISNMGEIHDTVKDKYTFGNKTKDGYLKYTIYMDDGTATSQLVHRMVANLFVEKDDPTYDIVDHINCIKTDNRAENLRWCTNAMNAKYASENGLMKKKKGYESPRHKYTREEILLAIQYLKTGKYTAKEVSEFTGIHIHTIRDLVYKRAYIDDVLNVQLNVKGSLRKFTDKQIKQVISMLTGEYTVKEISDKTGVSKIVIRGICKRDIYTYMTNNIDELLYKEVSKRADIHSIKKAINMLESRNFTCKEIIEKTGLTRSIVEKLAYHQRWTELTDGKNLGFANSKV